MAYIDVNGETRWPNESGSAYVPNPQVNIPTPSPQAPQGAVNLPSPFPITPGTENSGGGYGAGIDPSGRNYPGGSPTFDEKHNSSPNPRDAVVSSGSSSWEQALKQAGGSLYDPSDLAGMQRNVSYAQNAGKDPQQFLDAIIAGYAKRANNTPGPDPNDPRTATSRPTGNGAAYNPQGPSMPGYQFNDPYSQLLEQLAQKQIESLTGNNPQTQQLMDFLNKQFAALSTSNGYTPDELAVLRTQALEPIEAQRRASQQRELDRTSRAGYLPTSGITLDQQRQIDTGADQARTAASRDLAINSINRQDQQRNQAIQLGQLGMQIPQQQGAQALDVANILYQLPRQAMLDAEGVINGSSPQSVISPLIQLLQNQQGQAAYNQQQSQQQMDAIGRWIASIFG